MIIGLAPRFVGKQFRTKTGDISRKNNKSSKHARWTQLVIEGFHFLIWEQFFSLFSLNFQVIFYYLYLFCLSFKKLKLLPASKKLLLNFFKDLPKLTVRPVEQINIKMSGDRGVINFLTFVLNFPALWSCYEISHSALI